jgi:FxLD family lantipeptide
MASPLIDSTDVETDADFRLDLSVVMAATPVAALMRSTSDNCGSSCPNACATRATYPD